MRSPGKKAIVLALTAFFLASIFLPVYAEDTVYKKGDKAEIIAEAQQALKQLGFFDEECTGYFGEVTEKAIRAFQKKYDLGVDGKLGNTTLSWLEKLTKNSKLNSRAQARRDISKSDVNYTVRKGDTIWDIAADYNVKAAVIMEANNLEDTSVLQIGQVLVIPNVVTYVKPKSAASPAISSNTSVKTPTVSAEDKTETVKTADANADAATDNDGYTIYVVKEGDTILSIAEDFGVKAEAVLELNNLTEDAVLQIEQELKIPKDADENHIKDNDQESSKADDEKTTLVGEYLNWFGVVDGIYKNGDVATVTDIDTGKSFRARRLYGKNHADVEPLTTEDTEVMKSIYGEWSWDRRAVIVTIDGHNIAGSMNGMPHGDEAIKDNNFEGQFCIHFKGSKTHKNNRVDPGHQAAVRKAAGLK